MEKPKTNRKHLPEQQNPSLDDRNLKLLLVEFPYGDLYFPIMDVIHVLHIAGRHRHSTPHVSWNIGEASRTEVAI